MGAPPEADSPPGARVHVHQQLYEADVNVYASSGVANGRGGYGYVIYVRPEEVDRAATAVGVGDSGPGSRCTQETRIGGIV
jgi:hypothetical protein